MKTFVYDFLLYQSVNKQQGCSTPFAPKMSAQLSAHRSNGRTKTALSISPAFKQVSFVWSLLWLSQNINPQILFHYFAEHYLLLQYFTFVI